jgi:hypothetical protein
MKIFGAAMGRAVSSQFEMCGNSSPGSGKNVHNTWTEKALRAAA